MPLTRRSVISHRRVSLQKSALPAIAMTCTIAVALIAGHTYANAKSLQPVDNRAPGLAGAIANTGEPRSQQGLIFLARTKCPTCENEEKGQPSKALQAKTKSTTAVPARPSGKPTPYPNAGKRK